MMEYTDRHFRFFARCLSKRVSLYTEMVTAPAILRGDKDRHLKYDSSEHPLALQLGGSDPDELGRCAKYAQEWGYDELNLNVGCPSDRVQEGKIGACLLKEASLVGDCVQAMLESCEMPVTIKTRIGVDDYDSLDELLSFIDQNVQRGCHYFTLHARKAWLQGLSPKENRTIPPLDYERVYQVKEHFPHIGIELNGGVERIEDMKKHLEKVDSIMLGRAAYENPWLLSFLDESLHGESSNCSKRSDIVAPITDYIKQEIALGTPVHRITRHLGGLFWGVPGAGKWRRCLAGFSGKTDLGVDIIAETACAIDDVPSA
ncbi:MAG: tRNA dihydrouridine(20/20a) synthase DusA [Planctomycetes bacterium]|nr:tRNA dihydrouridine(20/20a) synthase DusA [Planctomycetota bacterium]